jgi:glycosyltransferase involved in cell wall biosynthesis
MGDTPFISICIPAYRRKENLKRLLDSIETQNFHHFEVVITDDSPDDELRNLIEFHPLGNKIRYFKNENTLGSPENWNRGLKMARAEWIKIMHDDDWFTGPESLHIFTEAIKKGTSAFYFSAYTNVYPEGHLKTVRLGSNRLSVLSQFPEILFVSNRIGPPSAVLFKKEASIFFDNRMKWLVDIDFYIRYLKSFGPPQYIPEKLIFIGIDKSQITNTSFGNPGIEIPERFMLGEKLDETTIKHLSIFDAWWRFIRNLKIRDVSQIRQFGYQHAIPAFIPPMIEMQNKISAGLLRIGFISKMCMFFCYLRVRNYRD